MPEDRLKAVLPGIGIFTPLSVLGYGLTTEFIKGYLGISFNIFWLFLNGVGVSSVERSVIGALQVLTMNHYE